jgi:hypothetical protein
MAPKDKRAKRAPGEPLRRWLLAGVVALLTARLLVPSDAVAHLGGGLVFAMLWVLLAIGWLVRGLRMGQIDLRFEWIDAAVVALVGWHTVSGFIAVGHGSPRPAINVTWEWIGIGLAYFLIRQLVFTGVQARAVVGVMISLAVALAALGFYQFFVTLPEMRAEYERNPDAMLQGSAQYFAPGPERERFEDRLNAREPMATFVLANSLAGYLAPWIIVTLGIVVVGRASAQRDTVRMAALLLAVLLMAGCLLLTKSRSGVVAAAVGALLVWPVCGGRLQAKRVAIAVLLAIALGAGAWLVGGADRQVITEAGRSLSFRMQYWKATVAMIAEQPLFGCGPGQFQDRYPQFKLPEASEEIQDPHNFLLEVWATAGTPAAIALLAVLAIAGTRAWQAPTVDRRVEVESGPDGAVVQRGALGGVFLAVPVGLASGFAVNWPATFLALAAVICVSTLLVQWIENGPLPPRLLGLAAAVLLVNLLAAGGIGYAGVGGTLWLSVALIAALTSSPAAARRYGKQPAIVATAAMGLVAVMLFVTAYYPVLESEKLLRQASTAHDDELRRDYPNQEPAEARESLRSAAVAADAKSARAARELAQYRLQLWQSGTASRPLHVISSDAVIEAYEQAARLAPNSASTQMDFAQALHQIFAATDDVQFLKQAIGHYRRAAELYPTSGRIRASLALALETGADLGIASLSDAIAQAAEGLRLDDITQSAGHADRVLPGEIRDKLELLASQSKLTPASDSR